MSNPPSKTGFRRGPAGGFACRAAINRRNFGGIALVLGLQSERLLAASGLDQTLREGAIKRKIPAAVFMAATADKTLFSGAYGHRHSASTSPLSADTIFRIASMTKALTSVA